LKKPPVIRHESVNNASWPIGSKPSTTCKRTTTVRRDKRERAAFAATQEGCKIDDEDDENENDRFDLKVVLPIAGDGDEMEDLME
jgi:hypothetical protein